MKKGKEVKQSRKASENRTAKAIKEKKGRGKTKMPAVTNYYLEELPKR